MTFKTPWVLIFIPVLAGIVWWMKRRQTSARLQISSSLLFDAIPVTWKVRLRWIPDVLRGIVLFLFVVALAGPRLVLEETVLQTEGIDIVLAIDASGSMAAEDFKIQGKRVNRLAIVKEAIKEFIEKREHDRIGLLAFAGLAYTVCPLTTDYAWLQKNLERVELGLMEDGTAVGSAIASGLSRLEKSEATSKVIILLTDGMNNAGKIDPLTAAQAARSLGIKIYTIGAGSKGQVPFPATDFFGRKVYVNQRIDLDEETLTAIADETGGQYFRATDTEGLHKIYETIDALEKTNIEETGFFLYDELFDIFLFIALLLLIMEIILRQTLFLKVP